MNKHVLPRCNGSTRGYESSFIRDRKSTRLNSSHSQISYAVFCLKKKKEQETLSFAGHTAVLRNDAYHYLILIYNIADEPTDLLLTLFASAPTANAYIHSGRLLFS